MEEILASIRRIISDEEAAISDNDAPAQADAAPEPEEVADPEAEMSQDDLDALFDAPAPAPVPDPEPESAPEDDMAAAMAEMAQPDPEPEEPEEDVLVLQEEWQETDLVEPHEPDLVFGEMDQHAPEPVLPAAMEEAVHKTLEEKVPPLLKASIETEPTPDGPLPDVERGQPLVSDTTSAAVTSAFGSLSHTILSQNTRTMENVVEDMLRPMLKAWLDQNLPVMVERLVRAEIERVSRGEQTQR